MGQWVFPSVSKDASIFISKVKESNSSSLLDPRGEGTINLWNNGIHSTTQHLIWEDLNPKHMYLYYQISQGWINLMLILLLELVMKLPVIFNLTLCVFTCFCVYMHLCVHLCVHLFLCFSIYCIIIWKLRSKNTAY